MKTRVKVLQEIEIKTVVIDLKPRYIGDTDDDDMPTDFPLLDDSKTHWCVRVDIDTGIIEGWPDGETRDMHVKVCDEGIYRLLDANGAEVAMIADYVPHGVVPGSYGDYVELAIDGAGRITNWPDAPDVSRFFADEYPESV